jgi:arginase
LEGKKLSDTTEKSETPAISAITLTGVPYDEGSSFLKGPAEGPNAIREAFLSSSSNLWTETGVDLGAAERYSDAGDVTFGPEKNAFSNIEAGVRRLLSRPTVPILLGGDHSITYPAVKAFSGMFGKINILHFDAHPDLYDELDGKRFSHASPFARILEENLAGRLVQVGIRTLNGHQRRQAEKFGVDIVEMRHIDSFAAKNLPSPLYISVDLDALDPAYAPGVSHHEPGGLSTRQMINMIHSVKSNVVGADIVELNPARDPLGITAMAAAKILKELMGVCIRNAGPHEKIS